MQYTIALLLLSSTFAAGEARHPLSAWQTKNFKTLVTFGDSYTDENRLGYFIGHNGTAPPVGWEQGVGYKTSTGGLSWPRYAAIYSKASLYNYAVSGAVCSNKITPRYFSAIKAPFPDIDGYELPAFIADSKYRAPNGTAFFSGKPHDTVYAMWIGTNDVGNDAFLTDSQVKGKTLKDYVDCVYDTVGKLYNNGGRYFVLMNLAPLELVPQYATPENGGLTRTRFFSNKGSNITEISYRMWETVATVNQIYAYRTPFEAELSERWPGIKMASFDVNSLITDMWMNPKDYLNGTAPANVTGFINQCDAQGGHCVDSPSKDSYLWYDELHPSEQADRIIAREFVGVLGGKSKWATYWG